MPWNWTSSWSSGLSPRAMDAAGQGPLTHWLRAGIPREPGARAAVYRRAELGDAPAANLLGAIVGGALEYLSLIAGYHVLLIVNGGLYGLAFVPGLRSRPASLSG